MKAFVVVFFIIGAAFAEEAGDDILNRYTECLAKNYEVLLSNITFNHLIHDCVDMRPEYSSLKADADTVDKLVAETVDEIKQYHKCEDRECRQSIVGCITVRALWACAETRRLAALMQDTHEDKEVAKCMKLPLDRIEKSVNGAMNAEECYN